MHACNILPVNEWDSERIEVKGISACHRGDNAAANQGVVEVVGEVDGEVETIIAVEEAVAVDGEDEAVVEDGGRGGTTKTTTGGCTRPTWDRGEAPEEIVLRWRRHSVASTGVRMERIKSCMGNGTVGRSV